MDTKRAPHVAGGSHSRRSRVARTLTDQGRLGVIRAIHRTVTWVPHWAQHKTAEGL